MSGISELSKAQANDEESRSQAIGEFVDVTQADPIIAKHILEAHDWNIENAVSYFLETGGVAEILDDGDQGVTVTDDDAVPRRSNRQGRSRSGPIVVNDDDDVVCVEDSQYEEDEDIRTLASYRTRRAPQQVDYNEDTEEEEEYADDDVYGDEEERFKYGRRSRRGNRRRLRRVQEVCPQPEEMQVPAEVLTMPDVNIEEQKMLMAALTGEVYDGEIPDFRDPGIRASYVPKPLSPGAVQRQMLREEQDLAFKESLEMDKEKERQRELMQIGQMEREESVKREKEALEEKKRRLPSEPGADDTDSFMLVIRMPSGSRLKRRFSFEDSLRSAFDFIDVTAEAELVPGTYQLVSQVRVYHR